MGFSHACRKAGESRLPVALLAPRCCSVLPTESSLTLLSCFVFHDFLAKKVATAVTKVCPSKLLLGWHLCTAAASAEHWVTVLCCEEAQKKVPTQEWKFSFHSPKLWGHRDFRTDSLQDHSSTLKSMATSWDFLTHYIEATEPFWTSGK